MAYEKYYQRFSLSQRVEHWVLVASFALAALTGIPQKYVGAAWAEVLIRLLGGIEVVRIIHRVAAVVLILECIYHALVIAHKVIVWRTRFSILLTFKDLRDLIGVIRYNLRLTKERPLFDRFSYEEKLEYWAVVWGTVIMVITGFLMWNPIAATRFLAGQIIPAAKAAHGGEALLAILAIVTWHFYNVLIKRFNRSMFAGKVSENEMEEEHPLELARIKAGEDKPSVSPRRIARRKWVFVPIASLITAALVAWLYWFATFEETAIETIPRTGVSAFVPAPTPTPTPSPSPTPTPAAVPARREAPAAKPPTAGAPSFASDILPALQANCSACHGPAAMAGLNLESYEGLMKGGDSGPAASPGNPDKSRIVEKMTGGHAAQLSQAELEALKKWIAAGAAKN